MEEMRALADVFKLRPEMFMAGMRSLDNVRQEDQQKLQQQELANQQATLQNQFAQENNPIRQEQARFGLMKDRAMFPGDMAASRGQVRKEQEAGNLTQEQVPQALTHAAALASSPDMQTPAIHGVMRSIMKNAYVPEIMDQWTPAQFQANLPKMLNAYSNLLPKNQAAQALQGTKDDGKMALEQERSRRAESVARISAAARNTIKSNEPKSSKDYEAYATKLMEMADRLSMPGASEEDLARAQIYYDRGREYRRMHVQDKINTTPNAKPGIDVTQLTNPDGTPRFPAKPIPQPTEDRRAAPGVADRPARQAASERVTIYKDGKAVGTVPKAQQEQAIKEGYTLK